MSLDVADIIAAYDAAYTAMHSNAASIPDAAAGPFQKAVGLELVHNTAMLLQLQATALRDTQDTKQLTRDNRTERLHTARPSTTPLITLKKGCTISVLAHRCIYCATQPLVT